MTEHSWIDSVDEHPSGKIVIRVSGVTAFSRPWILTGMIPCAQPALDSPAGSLVNLPACDDFGPALTTCTDVPGLNQPRG
ncbi:hypothetical protein ACIBG7_05825 [Nonomuraea sp. NPDC050328]|uniref:hypothetical protein n=1 Tax=Nonomuraea sp. NPDC050328 TaxID=3364361 RepID=UPI00379F2FBF